MGGKARWVSKQRKKKTRARLKKARVAEETRRLRARVERLARAACSESRVGKCMSRYTQFGVAADGSFTVYWKPLFEVNRNELRQWLETGFEPIERKGQIELLVDAIDATEKDREGLAP